MFVTKAVQTATFLSVVSMLATMGWSQAPPQISSLDRGRAQDMLRTVASEVRKHYYDPKFHGVDWDAKVAEAKQKIEKTTSMNMAHAHLLSSPGTLLPPRVRIAISDGWRSVLCEPCSPQKQCRNQGSKAGG